MDLDKKKELAIESIEKSVRDIKDIAEAFSMTGNENMSETLYYIAREIYTGINEVKEVDRKKLHKDYDATMKEMGNMLSIAAGGLRSEGESNE